jgi:hypothetical protein
MPRESIEPAPVFSVDGRVADSEAVHCYAGAHVLELATWIPDLGVHLEALYVTGGRGRRR